MIQTADQTDLEESMTFVGLISSSRPFTMDTCPVRGHNSTDINGFLCTGKPN